MEPFLSTLPLRVAQPEYLVLLAILPLVVIVATRSLIGLGSVRRLLAIALRCGVITVLTLALAGPERVRVRDDQTAVFAVDRSASIPRERQQVAFDSVKAATRAMRPGQDRIALLTFDGAPIVEQLAAPQLWNDRLGDGVKPHQTNLAAALRMAMALFPPDTARRIVLLSDGNENMGDVLDEADACAAAGIPIDVLPLRYEPHGEMLIERLSATAPTLREYLVEFEMIWDPSDAGFTRQKEIPFTWRRGGVQEVA